MRRLLIHLLSAVTVLLLMAPPAVAVETDVTVRVLSQDAKLIGSSMGGVQVVLRDADTGELLAQGITEGSTGDTDLLMRTPRTRHTDLGTEGSAAYRTTLDLDRPTLVEIAVFGPLAQRQSAVAASSTRWIAPGKSLTGSAAVVIELSGFVVDVLDPPAHSRQSDLGVEVRVNLTMLCGCPVTPGGLWDADEIELTATLLKDGDTVARVPLEYAGSPSQFRARLQADGPGAHEILVTAFYPASGNTGVDRTTVVIESSRP